MNVRIICLPKKVELEMYNKLNSVLREDEIKAKWKFVR
jgi:hypothetical protein